MDIYAITLTPVPIRYDTDPHHPSIYSSDRGDNDQTRRQDSERPKAKVPADKSKRKQRRNANRKKAKSPVPCPARRSENWGLPLEPRRVDFPSPLNLLFLQAFFCVPRRRSPLAQQPSFPSVLLVSSLCYSLHNQAGWARGRRK